MAVVDAWLRTCERRCAGLRRQRRQGFSGASLDTLQLAWFTVRRPKGRQCSLGRRRKGVGR